VEAKLCVHSPPGQLVGGPNDNAQSGVEPPNLGALSYTDESTAYSCNEYAVDIDANLLFVLASANANSQN